MDFLNLYKFLKDEMIASLECDKDNIKHPTIKGNAAENAWIKFLRDHLPSKYSVDTAIIVNDKGETSDQIDIVIYDANTYPILLNHNNIKYLCIESVYAVFEVKQNITSRNLNYAIKKTNSVKELINEDLSEQKILGGLLAFESKLKNKTINFKLCDNNPEQSLDFVCALKNFSYINPKHIKRFTTSDEQPNAKFHTGDHLLYAFLMLLVYALERIKTHERKIYSYAKTCGIEIDDGSNQLY